MARVETGNTFRHKGAEDKAKVYDPLSRFADSMEYLQELERVNIGQDVVSVDIPTSDSVTILTIGDLHLGSIATDNEAIVKLRDYILETEGIGVILLGDEIEGMVQKYMNTNTARTPIDFQTQLDLFEEGFLRPLVEQGKILTMVGGYWGHNGWGEDATTLNPWRLMTQRLENEGYHVPIVRNGGRLELTFKNGYMHTVEIRHNPTGNSKFDPLHGPREATLGQDESVRPDGNVSAHIHRMAVAKELFAGAKAAAYFISSGTDKGSNPELPPDRFGVKLARPLADPRNGAQGVTIGQTAKGEESRAYPFANLRQGAIVHEALRLLNSTERQGLTTEIGERIRAEVEAEPGITMLQDKSIKTRYPYGKIEDYHNGHDGQFGDMLVPSYDKLAYDIQTLLPITLHLIANARLGSESSGYDPLLKFQNDLILNDPHSLVVYLRSMIDAEVADSPNRKAVLDELVDLINPVKEQTLAIMLSREMRLSKWKKALGDDNDLQPIPAGSYVSQETGVPLIHHLSYLELTVGPDNFASANTVYMGAFADRLNGHGSKSKPTFGLKRLYDLYLHDKPGFLAGGHMPNAGTMTFYDRTNKYTPNPIVNATGWWAKDVDTLGKGSARPGAKPGQAIILMPGRGQEENLAFPTASADETKYMSQALMLLAGARILGIEDQLLAQKAQKKKRQKK